MRRSKITAVVSDLHFDAHDPPTWRAFRAWHAAVKPAHTIVLGDMIDFGMLSQYAQHANAQDRAIPQILAFVAEANALALECRALTIVEGNHDERWAKLVGGPLGAKLRGAIGLSLREQCQFQGLDKRIEWRVEDTLYRGVQEGPFLLRHGHKQASRFGAKHLAAARLTHTMGDSEIIGHHHRVQMMCQTAGGRTAIAITNGHMAADQEYSPDANWQRGFTIIERFGDAATAYPIVIDRGAFAWSGRVFDGNETAPNRPEIPDRSEADGIDVDLSELAPRPAGSNTPHLVTAFGRTQCLAEWRRETGISERAIRGRIARGWTAEDAVSKRPDPNGNRPAKEPPRDAHGHYLRGETLQ